MKTQRIAGHELTLEVGQRYLATRPVASRGRQTFPIRIIKLEGGIQSLLSTNYEYFITGLSYFDANIFLSEFNNGPTSFDGRVW